MKLKNLIQRIFCKDLLEREKHLEETVKNISAERDVLSADLETLELTYNMLLDEYNNYRTCKVKVPHCESCKSCKREEVAVGKVVFSCERMGGKKICVKERRTSPKWCPLRQRVAIGELTSQINSATEAAKKLGEEVSKI